MAQSVDAVLLHQLHGILADQGAIGPSLQRIDRKLAKMTQAAGAWASSRRAEQETR